MFIETDIRDSYLRYFELKMACGEDDIVPFNQYLRQFEDFSGCEVNEPRIPRLPETFLERHPEHKEEDLSETLKRIRVARAKSEQTNVPNVPSSDEKDR